jgi:hypothetical protein
VDGRANDPCGAEGKGVEGIGGAAARGGRAGLDSLGGGGGGTAAGNGRPGGGLDGEPGRDLTGETGRGKGFVGDVGRDDERDWNVIERGNGEVASSRGMAETEGIDCEGAKGDDADAVLPCASDDIEPIPLPIEPVSDFSSNKAMRPAARLPTGEAVWRTGGTLGDARVSDGSALARI